MATNSEKWKKLFAARILSRGYDYYLDGCVRSLRKDGDTLSAVVEGSEDYHVSILYDGNEVKDMDCTCPYAEDGNYCKHEAAVLYRISEQGRDESEREGMQSEQEELSEVLDKLSDDQLRQIILEIVDKDTRIKDRIMLTYKETIDERQMNRLKAEIAEIEYRHSDRSGFIDWRNAWDYVSELIDFMDDNVRPLIDRGKLREAFILTCEVFINMGNAEIDDDGDIATGANECVDYWSLIVDKATDEGQREIYEWFKENTGTDIVIDYMDDYLRSFLMTGFSSETVLQEIIEELDEQIIETEEKYKSEDDRWYIAYHLNSLVCNRADNMEKLGLSRKEVISFLDQYTYLPQVLIRYANECYKYGNVEMAIAALEKGKERANEKTTVASYSRNIIDIYNAEGRVEELRRELLYNLTNCIQKDLTYYRMLKYHSAAEELPAVREKVLASKTADGIRLDVYKEDGLTELLAEEILKRGNVALMERYEESLLPEYETEVRDLVAAFVRTEMANVSDRTHYRHLVKYLKKLKKYHGGKELAKSIADGWRMQYPRRSAMIDELNKAGFM